MLAFWGAVSSCSSSPGDSPVFRVLGFGARTRPHAPDPPSPRKFGGSSEGDQTESSLGRQEDASELSLLGQVNRQKCQIHHRRDAKCPAGHQRGPRAPGQAGELPGTAGGDVQVANLPPHSMSPAFLDPVPTRVGGFGGSRRQIQAQNAKPYVRKKSQGILDQKHIWGVSQWRGEANGELHPLT